MRFLLLAALVVRAAAQSDAPASFEAASVKLNTSGSGSSSSHTRTANVQITNMSMKSIITMAYRLKDYQVEGPSWLANQHFDIVAKAATGTPDKELMTMLRTLLVERFKLETHRETKEFPVWGLVAAKGGIKIKLGEGEGGGTSSNNNDKGGELTATNITMDGFAQWMSHFMDRPVVDVSGIEGKYTFGLKYSKENQQREESDDVQRYPVLTLAIQEQLGLRVEKRTAPIEMMVIDHAEKEPEGN